MTDFTMDQLERGEAIAGVLNITLGNFYAKLADNDFLDTVPKELEDSIVQLIEGLDRQRLAMRDVPEGTDEMTVLDFQDARGDYLQALASLSTPALKWIGEAFK